MLADDLAWIRAGRGGKERARLPGYYEAWQSDASRRERSFAAQGQNKRPCEDQAKTYA